MALERKKKRRGALYPLVLVGILLLAGASFFVAGFRITGDLMLVRAVPVTITDIAEHSTLYVNNYRRGTVRGGETTLRLTPGRHAIILHEQQHSAWYEEVVISRNEPRTLRAFMIPRSPSGAVIGEDSPLFLQYDALLRGIRLPERSQPLPVGEWSVFVEQSSLVRVRGDTEETVFEPSSGNELPVRSVVAFPGRDDMLLVGAGEFLYAIELDPTPPQTAATVLRGSTPRATVHEGTIIARDALTTFTLEL